MFLSKRDVEELTGYKSWRHQVEWLKNKKYRFNKRKNGSPVILKIEVERVLFGGQISSEPKPDYTKMEVAA